MIGAGDRGGMLTRTIGVSDLVLRNIAGNSYMVNPYRPHGDKIWSVNRTVVEVWRLLCDGVPADRIASALAHEFDLPADFDAHGVCAQLLSMTGVDAGLQSSVGHDRERVLGDACVVSVQDGVPLYGGVELTWGCNLKCVHCYIRPQGPSGPRKDLSATQWFGILNQLRDAGCLYLTISGGEPLIHPEFRQIYEHAALGGFLIDLYTNATLVDEDVADLLSVLPPRRVEVSMYGATAPGYEGVTGMPGSYRSWLRGLSILSEHRVPVVLKGIVLKENRSEIQDMRAFAEARGCEVAFGAEIMPRLDGARGPEDHRLSPEGAVEVWIEVTGGIDPGDEVLGGKPRFDDVSGILDCGAGRTSFQVGPTGLLSYCTRIRTPGIDLGVSPMLDAWPKLRVKSRESFGSPSECPECPSRPYCNYCPGVDRLEAAAGSEEGYTCRYAHARRRWFERRRDS